MLLSGAKAARITKLLKLYAPTSAQARIHASSKRFKVIRFGRQSGKSTYGINNNLDKAWKKENGMYWYVGPTYRLAEQMHDRTLFALRNCIGVVKDRSYSELMIQLDKGSRIFYKSGDNPEGLLGETLDGCTIDEAAKQKKDLWTRTILPMLGTTNGWCDFLSTPDGYNWFYDLDQRALTNPEWGSFHAPSTSNPLWTPAMVQEAKESMSEDLFAQEILAEFRELGAGTCLINFGSHNILDRSPFATHGQDISPYLPILVGMDFNLNPMSWILGQHKNRQIYYHDEIVLANSHTPEAAEVLCAKVKNHKEGVLLIGDASGNAGQRAAAGKSDYSIIKERLRAHGIPFQDRTPESNPGIKDRVNTANAALKAAAGNISVWFHPRCKTSIKDCQRRRWKENAAQLAFDNSDPNAGHSFDAATYPISALIPIKNLGSAKVSVIMRSL